MCSQFSVCSCHLSIYKMIYLFNFVLMHVYPYVHVHV